MSGKLSWSCWASSGLSILGYLHGRCSLLPVRLPAFPGGLHTWHWMWVTPFCFGSQWPRQKLSSNSGLLYIICNQKQGLSGPQSPKAAFRMLQIFLYTSSPHQLRACQGDRPGLGYGPSLGLSSQMHSCDGQAMHPSLTGSLGQQEELLPPRKAGRRLGKGCWTGKQINRKLGTAPTNQRGGWTPALFFRPASSL